MFLAGRYDYSLDDRGRIPLPPALREHFAGGVMLQQAPSGCVRIYTMESFEHMARLHQSVPETSRKGNVLRYGFFPNCWPAEVDRQGRLLIPQVLRRHASLDGAVVVVGTGESLDVWSPAAYEQHMERVRAEYEVALESVELRQ